MANVYKTEYGLNVSVEIIRDAETDNARVKVIAPMYMNKEWFMGHSYKASEFSDYEILRDHSFTTTMIEHYPSEK